MAEKMSDKKTAVILFNLGGPDSREAIKPFLFNFFMDKNIIRAPLPVRWLVAKLISVRRSKREAGDSYAELGDKSPLLENTQAQANALEKTLGEEFRVFVSMRYWHPMADEAALQVKEYDPAQIILLPLYPQFSTTTTRSSFQTWDKAAAEISLKVPTERFCCYPMENGFVTASAENITTVYEQACIEADTKNHKAPRVLFSAHGLPEDIVKSGDPYQWQCEQTAATIVTKMGTKDLDWQICYQSRVGPKKWLGPSTEDALQKAADDQVPVVIYPHAFTQEHVETLVEIEIEYREMAEEMGVLALHRVPTVSTHPAFISGLADMVKSAKNTVKNIEGTYSNTFERLCPSDHKDCCMAQAALQDGKTAAMKKAA